MTTDKQIQDLLNKIEELKKQVQDLDKPQFEVGKVYKSPNGLLLYNGDKAYCIGFWRGLFDNDWTLQDSDGEFKPATTEEWKEALINHAKKMGYKEGVTVDRTGIEYWVIKENVEVIINNTFNYNEDNDVLFLGVNVIYYKGKWAKIIEPEKIMVGDNEVGFIDELCYINDFVFTRGDIKALIPANPTLFNKILERMK